MLSQRTSKVLSKSKLLRKKKNAAGLLTPSKNTSVVDKTKNLWVLSMTQKRLFFQTLRTTNLSRMTTLMLMRTEIRRLPSLTLTPTSTLMNWSETSSTAQTTTHSKTKRKCWARLQVEALSVWEASEPGRNKKGRLFLSTRKTKFHLGMTSCVFEFVTFMSNDKRKWIKN